MNEDRAIRIRDAADGFDLGILSYQMHPNNLAVNCLLSHPVPVTCQARAGFWPVAGIMWLSGVTGLC